MGTFDTIFSELECPTSKKNEKQEIQIKWYYLPRMLIYKIGDKIEELRYEGNVWIKDDYMCESCDRQWHDVYINVTDKTLIEVLSEQEFNQRGISDHINQ
jgi:hypothetical protein